MNRSTLKYLALIALTVFVFYWKTLLTGEYTLLIGSEGVNMTYGWLHFWVRSVWQGHLPLWDPYAFGGRPFGGEMLPAAWYPLHLLFALVPFNHDGLISPRFYHEFLAFTHVLSAWLMFALLRELRCSRFAAFIGACSFSLGGLLVRMMWPVYIEACMWLPAIFLFVLRALRAERRDRAIVDASLAGLCLGMSILTGGMAFFVMQWIVATSAILYHGAITAPVSADRRAHWLRIGMITGAVLLVSIGIGAVQLIPANEYSRLAIRFIDGGTFPASKKIPYERLVPGLWPQSILSGLFPTAFGGKYGGEEIFPYYIGVLPLFLAIIAIWRRWNHSWVRYLTVLAILSFVYSLGELSFLNGVLYAIVPMLWATRSADRFFYLVSFALSILAAWGWDVVAESANQSWWAPARRALKWVASACAVVFLVPGIFNQINLGVWPAFSLLLILASCAFLAWLIRHPASDWLRITLAAFIIFDLGSFNWTQFDQATINRLGDTLAQVISLRGAADFIRSQPGLQRVRVGVSPEPNVGDFYDVQSIWGGGGTTLASYSRLGLRDNLLNVGYYIKPASATDPNPIYRDSQWKVFENPAAFPRAWLVHKTTIEPSEDAIYHALDDRSIDLHRTVLLEKPLPQPLEDTAGATESVRFRSYEADRLALDVDTPKAGMVVLSEFYYPGWHANLNGKPTAIYKVDGALRGIQVPAGSSRIELDYTPMTFYSGAAISMLTLLSVATGFILVRRKRSDAPANARKPAAVFSE